MATNAGMKGSIVGRVMQKTWKSVLAVCEASCSALTGGYNYKKIVHVQCCHWLVTSVALIAKGVAWPTAQSSGDRRRRTLVMLRKEYTCEYSEKVIVLQQPKKFYLKYKRLKWQCYEEFTGRRFATKCAAVEVVPPWMSGRFSKSRDLSYDSSVTWPECPKVSGTNLVGYSCRPVARF